MKDHEESLRNEIRQQIKIQKFRVGEIVTIR